MVCAWVRLLVTFATAPAASGKLEEGFQFSGLFQSAVPVVGTQLKVCPSVRAGAQRRAAAVIERIARGDCFVIGRTTLKRLATEAAE